MPDHSQVLIVDGENIAHKKCNKHSYQLLRFITPLRV